MANFQANGKKQTFFHFTKKMLSSLIKNYRSVSLFPICKKIFNRIIFDYLFKHSEKTIFLLCINLVLSWGIFVSNNLYLSLTRYIQCLIVAFFLKTNAFLEISKPFDKVWHDDYYTKLNVRA